MIIVPFSSSNFTTLRGVRGATCPRSLSPGWVDVWSRSRQISPDARSRIARRSLVADRNGNIVMSTNAIDRCNTSIHRNQSQTKIVKNIMHCLKYGTQMGWLINPIAIISEHPHTGGEDSGSRTFPRCELAEHPHQRGEDADFKNPRVDMNRNTPTSVGKIFTPVPFRKSLVGTPPPAWGRLSRQSRKPIV